jgi:DNA-binding Xre family transcriptional regulator
MRHAPPEYRRLALALKALLRQRRTTYGQVAAELGLSEASIKRLFTREDGPVGRLARISELLGLTFQDLVNYAHQSRAKINHLSPEQEAFFAEHLDHFDFFSELVVRRRTVDELRAAHGLSAGSTRRYLAALARIGILELRRGDRIKLLLEEPVGFSKNGRFRGRLLERFSKRVMSEVKQPSAGSRPPVVLTREWSFGPDTLAALTKRMEELWHEFDLVAAHEGRVLPRARLQSAAALFALIEPAPARWRIPELSG